MSLDSGVCMVYERWETWKREGQEYGKEEKGGRNQNGRFRVDLGVEEVMWN